MPVCDFRNAIGTWDSAFTAFADHKAVATAARPKKSGLAVSETPLYMNDIGDNEFEAYFSVFGNVDRMNEVVQRGAYCNLDEFRKVGFIGYNHDLSAPPIAYPIEAVQDSFGLKIRARWHSTPEGQAVRTIVNERRKAGLECLCSVGYKTLEAENATINGKSCRLLTRLALYECSVVGIPANTLASVISSKTKADDLAAVEDVRKLLPGFPVCGPLWRGSGKSERNTQAQLEQIRDAKLEALREKTARDRARFLLLEFERDWASRRPAELAAKAVDRSIFEQGRVREAYARDRDQARDNDFNRWR